MNRKDTVRSTSRGQARRYGKVLDPAWRGARVTARVLAVLVISAAAAIGAAGDSPRESVIKLVTRIQRADYEGNRPILTKLYEELAPFTENKELASRVRYWRGFALWRRAINGFNDSVDPKELEQDLVQAEDEFNKAAASDPGFADAKVAAGSCLSIRIGMNLNNPTRVQELVAQATPLLKDARAAEPDNPRLAWVLGPNLWYGPAERGGGQEKAIANYEKGLESARKQRTKVSDPLDPSWGEPELLMSLAWSHLNRTTPDLNAAEQDARAALVLVPYWHYVRDILIPQIQQAKAKG